MLSVVLSNQFKKDLKLAQKRGLNIALLTEVVDKLASGEELPPKNRDHNLSGDYAGYRECHIQPDWLLVYKVEQTDVLLLLFRTGTHSDLF
ncbi:MAG: type II toxin-antitoxin system YafQ family toxin [Bacilli bacterium]|nr:type II toxin-antitoxin system YafQ family toxin [Bacilli bacterium]